MEYSIKTQETGALRKLSGHEGRQSCVFVRLRLASWHVARISSRDILDDHMYRIVQDSFKNKN